MEVYHEWPRAAAVLADENVPGFVQRDRFGSTHGTWRVDRPHVVR